MRDDEGVDGGLYIGNSDYGETLAAVVGISLRPAPEIAIQFLTLSIQPIAICIMLSQFKSPYSVRSVQNRVNVMAASVCLFLAPGLRSADVVAPFWGPNKVLGSATKKRVLYVCHTFGVPRRETVLRWRWPQWHHQMPVTYTDSVKIRTFVGVESYQSATCEHRAAGVKPPTDGRILLPKPQAVPAPELILAHTVQRDWFQTVEGRVRRLGGPKPNLVQN